MRNRYPGKCYECACSVAAGEGYFERTVVNMRRYTKVRCVRCTAVAKANKGAALSRAQRRVYERHAQGCEPAGA